MITLIDGVQGAGKTYFAVDYMFNHVNTYYKILNNIDGFKKYENIESFKMSEFLSILQDCKDIFHDEDKSDEDIWEYLFSIDFLGTNSPDDIEPVLVVIDEAHNYFDTKNDLLVWFLSYHRHLFIDAILITQDSNLLHFAYRKLFQNIYHAIPASNNFREALFSFIPFSSKFRKERNKYQKHIRLPIYDGKNGTLTDVLYLDKKKEIYDLYNAGDFVRAKNIFRKYIIYFLILMTLAVIGLWWFTHVYMAPAGFDTSPQKQTITDRITSKAKHNYRRKGDNNYDPTSKYIYLRCMFDHCVNAAHNMYIHIDDIKVLIEDTQSKYLHSSQLSDDVANLYILATPDFFNLFKKRSYKDGEKGISFLH